MKKETIIYIEVYGGVVQDVYGLPKGWTYKLIDWDHGDRDEEHAELKDRALRHE